MSELEELMERFCPSGVEYHKLHQVAEYEKTRIEATNIDEKTYVGVDNLLPNKQGKIDSLLVPSDGRLIQFLKGDVLIGNIRPYLRKIWLAEYAGGTNGDVLVIHITKDSLDSKFLYYCLSSDQFFHYNVQFSKGAKMPRGDKSAIMEYEIPLPPPEIQRKIVHILDNFTELTAELTAELTVRKEQYEYYRNELLTLDESVKIVPLASIADIGTGSSNTNEALDEGLYPFYVRSQEPRRKNDYEYDETAIITAGDGVGVGKVFHYVEGKYALHQRAYRIHITSPDVLPKYYFHYMRATFFPYIEKTMYQGSVASIRRPMLNAFPVPVPTMEDQLKIVDVLDNFEAICSDLTIGLPAEIEARRQQYEYYRDKLLTFRRK